MFQWDSYTFSMPKYLYYVRPWNCVTTVGKNTTAIKEYIAKQSEEDKLGEQLRIDYPESPFK